jgi:CTP-dependent riboflavin kinase
MKYYNVSEVAKHLGCGRNIFFHFLRQMRYLTQQNEVTADMKRRGYMESIPQHYWVGKGNYRRQEESLKPVFTKKGFIWISGEFIKYCGEQYPQAKVPQFEDAPAPAGQVQSQPQRAKEEQLELFGTSCPADLR